MKILIIGGGLLGLSSAKVLLERGYDVEVLEAHNGVGLETSFANGGDLGAIGSGPWNTPIFGKKSQKIQPVKPKNKPTENTVSLFDVCSPVQIQPRVIPSMMVWGLKFLRSCTQASIDNALHANYQLGVYSQQKINLLRETTNLTYDAGSDGTLKLFRDEAAMASSIAMLKTMVAKGLKYRQLSADEAITLEPKLASIRGQFVGAVHLCDDERGDAHLFCGELAKIIKAQGGVIRSGIAVTNLVKKGRRVVGANTDQGFISADRVIVAAGSSSAKLVKTVGISLPIMPVKGHSLTLHMAGATQMPNIPVVDAANFGMVTPLGNRLRVAGLVDFSGFNKDVKPAAIDNLYKLLAALYPNISENVDRSTAQNWAGLRPLSADGKPFIGQSKLEGLFLNTGHGQSGWAGAMGSAYLLADLMESRPTEIDHRPFSATR